ncbi:hypothetical protein EYF80_025870 [Liparis tanakae]|uniref:Uncharacterized protein n=1 Tax=Liparis tanakae TaxID=230148 RepID=A0A4Z2HDI6_9TELE|nr:hypothetical protein EYF80_025870 [Liparis tanakae]
MEHRPLRWPVPGLNPPALGPGSRLSSRPDPTEESRNAVRTDLTVLAHPRDVQCAFTVGEPTPPTLAPRCPGQQECDTQGSVLKSTGALRLCELDLGLSTQTSRQQEGLVPPVCPRVSGQKIVMSGEEEGGKC